MGLAKWPAEGLTVYRTRYEGEAAALLESAHDDPPLLQRVYSLYFVTDAAKTAVAADVKKKPAPTPAANKTPSLRMTADAATP